MIKFLTNFLCLLISISPVCYAKTTVSGGIAVTATGDKECFNGSSDLLQFSINGSVVAYAGYIPRTNTQNVAINVGAGTYAISDQAFNVAGGTCKLSQSPSVTVQNNMFTPVTLSYHFSSSSPGSIGIAATATGDKECFNGSSDLLQFSNNGSVIASIGYIPSLTPSKIAMNVAPGMYTISGQAFNVPGGTCQLNQALSVNLQNNTFTPVNFSYQFKSANQPSRSGVALTAKGDTQCMGAKDTLLFSLNGSVAASIPYTTSSTSTNIDVAPGTYTISDQAFNVTGGTCKLSQSPSVTVQNNTYTPVSLSYTFTATPPTSSGIAATATGDTECLGGNDTLVFSANGSAVTSVPYILSASATKLNVIPGTYIISDQPFNVSGGICQLSQSPTVTIQNNIFTPVYLPYHFSSKPDTCPAPIATANGLPTWYRTCPIPQVPGLVYGSDPFTAFRVPRGLVDPAALPHILSSPFRTDGTALPVGYTLPTDLTARVVLYTEGNNWPLLGSLQKYPDPYNYPAEPWPYYTGLCFRNNQNLPMFHCDPTAPEELTTPGLDIVTVTNATSISVLITGGTMPGGEQPGQVMTPVNPKETTDYPVSPKGWYNYLQPEMYMSVAGLDPVDAITWHHNSPTHPDLGTPGFAYVVNAMVTPGVLQVGFRKNEGYDPNLSPDPGYGLALYNRETGTLMAVQDLYLLPLGRAAGTIGKMQQDLWSDPAISNTCYSKPNEFLYAGFALPENTTLRLEIVTHDAAQKLLAQKTGVLHCQFGDDTNCGKLCGVAKKLF